eukprot:Phypoly_transcript_17787.p1 GENE.Phypoly_transcript_17787~~Phypoly_transcript_17787.p1  ORF type:complete len:217 (+),score=24.38 Phypoly_transcript_17787:23-652(+)
MKLGLYSHTSFKDSFAPSSLWHQSGVALVSLWCRSGFPLVLLWCHSGFALLLWFRSGFALVSLWFCSGFALVLLWFRSGFALKKKAPNEGTKRSGAIVLPRCGKFCRFIKPKYLMVEIGIPPFPLSLIPLSPPLSLSLSLLSLPSLLSLLSLSSPQCNSKTRLRQKRRCSSTLGETWRCSGMTPFWKIPSIYCSLMAETGPLYQNNFAR